MYSVRRIVTLALLMSASALYCTSAVAANGAQWMFRLGLDQGGDNLAHVVYTDGSTADVRAGNGFYFAAGRSFPLTERLELDTTIGFEFSGVTASNGDITWSYVPVNVIALYKAGRLAFGGGVTDHVAPTLSGSAIASYVNTSYDNAVGSVVEGDHMIGKSILLGLRATHIQYKTNGYTSSGNSVGLTVAFKI